VEKRSRHLLFPGAERGLPATVEGEDSRHPRGREEGGIGFSGGGEGSFSVGGKGEGVAWGPAILDVGDAQQPEGERDPTTGGRGVDWATAGEATGGDWPPVGEAPTTIEGKKEEAPTQSSTEEAKSTSSSSRASSSDQSSTKIWLILGAP
jgi:hypothetical protein